MTRIPMLTAVALVLGVTGVSLAELNSSGDGGARGEQQGSLGPAPGVSTESLMSKGAAPRVYNACL
jgi:hypothetical protein